MSEFRPDLRRVMSGGQAMIEYRLAVLLLAVTGGCAVQDTVATRLCTADAPCPPAGNPPVAQYCEDDGPPILAGDGSGQNDICAGQIAERIFARALCTCTELVVSNTLTADSFASASGPYSPGGSRGAVGINGKIESTGIIQIAGALTVSGIDGINAGPELTVAGDLASAGPLGGAGSSVRVGQNARVAGDIQLQRLVVGGTLSLPDTRQLAVAEPASYRELQRTAVTVPPPCPCDAAELLDIPGYIESHRTVNHNDELGLDPDMLDLLVQDITVELPCGRFYFERIQGSAHAVTLRITGRTAVFISQGIDLSGSLRIEVEPAAELDLFIDGHINITGQVVIGNIDAPARTRVYINDAGTLSLNAGSPIGANVYAPLADLTLPGSTEIYGAVLVHRLLDENPVTIHYDTSVTGSGDACPAPGPE